MSRCLSLRPVSVISGRRFVRFMVGALNSAHARGKAINHLLNAAENLWRCNVGLHVPPFSKQTDELPPPALFPRPSHSRPVSESFVIAQEMLLLWVQVVGMYWHLLAPASFFRPQNGLYNSLLSIPDSYPKSVTVLVKIRFKLVKDCVLLSHDDEFRDPPASCDLNGCICTTEAYSRFCLLNIIQRYQSRPKYAVKQPEAR